MQFNEFMIIAQHTVRPDPSVILTVYVRYSSINKDYLPSSDLLRDMSEPKNFDPPKAIPKGKVTR